MKRKRMTKRIAAIILAAVMMIPTHVTSFAADASAQNTAGQEAGNATSGDSQTTQSENQAATQNDSSTTGTDTNAGSTGIQDRIHKTAQLQIQRAAQVQIHRTVQVQIHRAIQPIMLLQIRRAVQQQILTAQILPPVAQPIMLQVG